MDCTINLIKCLRNFETMLGKEKKDDYNRRIERVRVEFRKRLETRYESASENTSKDARWTYPEQYISGNIITETETILSSREESYKAGRVCGAVFIINGKQSRMRGGRGNYARPCNKTIRF